jgi:hypothetical protein
MIIDGDFHKNIEHLRSLNINTIEITGGGEPFLNPDLSKIIDAMKLSNTHLYIKIYTNGSILTKIPLISEVNISCLHWNDKINDKLMKLNRKPLKRIIQHYRNIGIPKIRLAIPMLKNSIDSQDKLLKFVELTDNLIDEYIVRPLSLNTPNYKDNYCEYECFHPKVVIDYQYCPDNFALIWAPNNSFYYDWALNNKINSNNQITWLPY